MLIGGADSLGSASSFHDYDYPAAAASPSTAPPWYDAASGRANVYVNPANVREYRGPARGYTLVSDGTVRIMTASGDEITRSHVAGEGFGVQFVAILSATSVVTVFW